MNIDFWFYVFCTVCEVNFPTTFREPLRVPSSLIMSQSVKMGPTVAPETSSGNAPRAPCKNPKTKNQNFPTYYLHQFTKEVVRIKSTQKVIPQV